MWSFPEDLKSRILVGADGFEVLRGETSVGRVQFDEVLTVEVYKRDELVTDLICFDVVVAGDPPLTWFLHEELPEWKDLVERLEKLAGFDKDWFAKVMQPAFAECRVVVYTRGEVTA